MGTPNPIKRTRPVDVGKYATHNEIASSVEGGNSALQASIDSINEMLGVQGEAISALTEKTADLSSDGSEYSGALTGTVKIETPPATATATGTPGQIIFAASGIYLCTALNTWKCFVPGAWPA